MALRLRKHKASSQAAPQRETARKASERQQRLAPYQWKKGQSGNPLGRPPGSASIVTWLKRRLAGPAFKRPDKFECLSQELADMILRHARRGNYNFVHLLLEKAEPRQLTQEEIAAETERIFNVVTKYVNDPAIRSNIARDLGLNAEPEKDQ